MSRSSQYPDERQARRILELACPEVDEETRENYAYLVSARRMTIDDAMSKLGNDGGGGSGAGETRIANGVSTAKASKLNTAAVPAPSVHGRRSSASATPYPNTAPDALPVSAGGPAKGDATGCAISNTNPYVGSTATRRAADATWKGQHRGGARLNNLARTSVSEGEDGRDTGVVAGAIPASTSGPAHKHSPHHESTDDRDPCNNNGSRHSSGAPYRAMVHTRDKRSSDSRVSRSDSELADLHEASVSLVRATEGDDAPHSSPSIIQKPRRNSYTKHYEEYVEEHRDTSKLRLRSEAAWAEEAERDAATAAKQVLPGVSDPASRGLGGCAEREARSPSDDISTEHFLSDMKLVTAEEQAAFQDKMKDMMHYWYGDETSMFDYTLRSLGRGQVLFFTTSMTGERAVRDHCRWMENLLHLKLIPYHTIDVADSEFFLRRVRKMYMKSTGKSEMPDMPLLFVDDKLIGDMTTVQELEDNSELDARLREAGCKVLRPRVMAALAAREAGLPEQRLVLPSPTSKKATALSARSPAASSNVASAPARDANRTAYTSPEVQAKPKAVSARAPPPTATAGASSARHRTDECPPVLSPVKAARPPMGSAYRSTSSISLGTTTVTPPVPSISPTPASPSIITARSRAVLDDETSSSNMKGNNGYAFSRKPGSPSVSNPRTGTDKYAEERTDVPVETSSSPSVHGYTRVGTATAAGAPATAETGYRRRATRRGSDAAAEGTSSATGKGSVVPRLPSLSARDKDAYVPGVTVTEGTSAGVTKDAYGRRYTPTSQTCAVGFRA